MRSRLPSIALLVLTLGSTIFYVVDLDAVSLWEGEATAAISRQLSIVEAYHRAEAAGESPLGAFTAAYSRYPKIGSDLINATIVLALGRPPIQSELKWLWSLVLVASFAMAFLTYAIFFGRIFRRRYAYVALILLTTNTYVLFYSSFPRQNLTAHAIAFAVVCAYLFWRSGAPALTPTLAFLLGLATGVACLVHYSAVQLVILLLAGELALVWWDRRPVATVVSIGIFLGSVAAVWFTADLYYLSYEPGGSMSVLSGFVYVMQRISGQEMAWKIARPEWWFGLGFVYRVSNPLVWVFAPLGIGWATWDIYRRAVDSSRGGVRSREGRLFVLAVIGSLLMFLVSIRYFAAARTLVHYLPILALTTCLGVRLFCENVKRRWGYRAGTVATILVALSLTLQYPRMLETYTQIRGSGQVNEWILQNGVDVVYVPTVPKRRDRLLASPQVRVETDAILDLPADGYLFSYRMFNLRNPADPLVMELWRKAERVRRLLRQVEPVAVFGQHNADPIYWYEFPLRPDVYDAADALSTTRRIYRVGDVQEALSQEVHREAGSRNARSQ